jgi:hypothetical protein
MFTVIALKYEVLDSSWSVEKWTYRHVVAEPKLAPAAYRLM